MVSIPSPVQNYLLLWGISLGSSVGLMFVAAAIYMVTGKTTGLTEIFVLMFNATATSFILLTMIPVGIFILVFGVTFNALAPLLAPIGAAIWNFMADFIIGFINLIPAVDIAYTPIQFVLVIPTGVVDYIPLQVPVINITEAITGLTEMLAALQEFLIEEVTGGNSGSGTWTPTMIIKLWS